MSQLIFKFPFKTSYFERDFFVSSNNFEAYNLIESWPKWPGRCINIFGEGKLTRDYISVKDAAELTYRCLFSKYVGPLNIASGHEKSTNQIVKELKKYFPKFKQRYKKIRVNEIKRFKCDIKKMLRILGKLEQNFGKSIKETILNS